MHYPLAKIEADNACECLRLLNQRAYYHDTREAGLSISITPVGTKTFFLRKKIEGRDERIVLGRYPDLTLENARKLATQRKGEIAVGKNLQAEI